MLPVLYRLQLNLVISKYYVEKSKMPDFKDDEERTKFFASKGGNLQTEIDRKAAEEAAKNP